MHFSLQLHTQNRFDDYIVGFSSPQPKVSPTNTSALVPAPAGTPQSQLTGRP